MKTEWVFYQEGNQPAIDSIKAEIEKDPVEYTFLPSLQPHDVATVVKNYFQDLEEPAIPFVYYPKFIACNLDVGITQGLVRTLPLPNKTILRVCLYFILYSIINLYYFIAPLPLLQDSKQLLGSQHDDSLQHQLYIGQ